MEEFIVRWGIWAVLVGAAFEGDASVIVAGIVAHLGLLHPAVVVAAAWAGGFVGDLVYYELGRRAAPRVMHTRLFARVAPVVARLADRVGLWQVVIARFVYGTRVASMLYWGIRGVSLARFAAFDLLGTALWATALVALGWALSGSAAALLGEVKRIELRLLGGVVVAAALVGLAHALGRRWEGRASPPPS